MPKIEFSRPQFNQEDFARRYDEIFQEKATEIAALASSIAELPETQDKYSNPQYYADYVVSEFTGCTLSDRNGSSYRSDSLKNLLKFVSGPEKDLLERLALSNIEAFSNSINPNIKKLAADFYLFGIGVDKNPEKAVELYTLAADQGHAGAQFSLGVQYEFGSGVDKDPVKAVEFYTLAADQGHTGAQFNLGSCYDSGFGVNKDPVKAVEFYTLAADQGHTGAQFSLGVHYGFGSGVNKDPVKAVEFYTLAADQGDTEAQSNLGFHYEYGSGVDKDPVKAVEFYTLAANQGLAMAQFNLGVQYESGFGVNKDPVKAVEFYTLAADQGHTGAQFNLGSRYDSGFGVDKDPVKAVEFYTLAANQGHAGAQCNLGAHYETGDGVASNHSLALNLYAKSAKQDYKKALERLSETFNPNSKFILTPLTKDEIIGAIEIAGSSEKYKERLQKPSSHFIGKFVEKSQDNLSLEDLLEIKESLQSTIGTSELGLRAKTFGESNSTTMIADCIFNKVKKHLKEDGFSEADLAKMEFAFQDDGIACRINDRGGNKKSSASAAAKNSYLSSDLEETLNPLTSTPSTPADYSTNLRISGSHTFSLQELKDISSTLEASGTYNPIISSANNSAMQLKEMVGKQRS